MSNLELFRREKGLTYQQLADITGLSLASARRLCIGKTKRIALEVAIKITAVTPLTLEELI